jgi:hypothetical protein
MKDQGRLAVEVGRRNGIKHRKLILPTEHTEDTEGERSGGEDIDHGWEPRKTRKTRNSEEDEG